MISRRGLIGSCLALAAAGLGKTRGEESIKPLRMLVLGGTGFIGPYQVDYALRRGHSVSVLNRNRTQTDLFKARAEQLVGDLSGDVSVLDGRRFDVVMDNPTTLPSWVRNAARYLAGHVDHYVFISTISVYRDANVVGADESAATTPLPAGLDPYTLKLEEAQRYYPALKSFAELEVARHYPNSTIIRPGLIVGPHDPTDRFTYWPVRVDRGGDVLAPGAPDDPVQFIDVRDLAEWTVHLAEARALGTYNAICPPMGMAEMLYGIKAVTTSGAKFIWVPEDFLAAQRIEPWSDMPVWVPPSGEFLGFTRRSVARAIAKGLSFRPLASTATDTLDWFKARPLKQQLTFLDRPKAGLSAAREREVLTAWKGHR
jgi:2'-hydroxyisoflavone reductase